MFAVIFCESSVFVDEDDVFAGQTMVTTRHVSGGVAISKCSQAENVSPACTQPVSSNRDNHGASEDQAWIDHIPAQFFTSC